ncbi:YbaB/EbfC family nucleoid-associated protein [Candidatus Peregrinibacteria bacterium]|nr:YbaB/EbfC family nucleoid-associated protein [Candidatus Peregrinibacteria bacterium]
MLEKIKDMYKLQKEAKQIKKELKNIHIEAESGEVIVTINGEQEVVAVKLPDIINEPQKIAENLLKAFNKAIKKSQQIAAERMSGVMKEMGLGNLLGQEK